jgi:hypothetical protein
MADTVSTPAGGDRLLTLQTRRWLRPRRMPETGLALPTDDAQWLTVFMRPRGVRRNPSAIST